MRSEEIPREGSGKSRTRESVSARLYRFWSSLERGWRAICLAALVVLAVHLGVPVPW